MASDPIFTDTSAWYAYIDKSDTEHAAAVKLVKNLDSLILIILSSKEIHPQITPQRNRLRISQGRQIGAD